VLAMNESPVIILLLAFTRVYMAATTITPTQRLHIFTNRPTDTIPLYPYRVNNHPIYVSPLALNICPSHISLFPLFLFIHSLWIFKQDQQTYYRVCLLFLLLLFGCSVLFHLLPVDLYPFRLSIHQRAASPCMYLARQAPRTHAKINCTRISYINLSMIRDTQYTGVGNDVFRCRGQRWIGRQRRRPWLPWRSCGRPLEKGWCRSRRLYPRSGSSRRRACWSRQMS